KLTDLRGILQDYFKISNEEFMVYILQYLPKHEHIIKQSRLLRVISSKAKYGKKRTNSDLTSTNFKAYEKVDSC
ncbi:MAG TPA: hypothetical protein VFE54_12885, partial [Mucilaginibacter sp.]|nr:hypothetical protein [Mucilaginibacter sp.]